jgi:bifunctional non-homologous end joining protein LigD
MVFVPPMLARLVRTLPEGPEWEYELKLDGYRLEAIKDGDKVRLYSRRGNDFTSKFARIATAVSKINPSSAASPSSIASAKGEAKGEATTFILDGEAVAVDAHGKPSFQMLQNRASLPPGWSLAYYAFDLLHLDGQDLKDRPLRERRALLQKLLVGGRSTLNPQPSTLNQMGVLFSQSLPGTLGQIMQAVKEHGLEGIIAKRLDSKYRPGHGWQTARSGDWLKLPLKPSQTFVIGAYRLDSKRLELLLVGYLENGKLLFAGKVHQGLNPANRRSLLKVLQPLATKKCPFADLPTGGPEIKYAEWTTGGLLRHAEFVTLRPES